VSHLHRRCTVDDGEVLVESLYIIEDRTTKDRVNEEVKLIEIVEFPLDWGLLIVNVGGFKRSLITRNESNILNSSSDGVG
jgi:hypothetical protein